MHLFLLGLAGGLAVLAATSVRRVTPLWLRWLLMAAGLLLVSRYTAMAAYITMALNGFPRAIWPIACVGFTLPAAFALDQLIRHPAMTPSKLLRWYAPVPVAGGLALLTGSGALLATMQAAVYLGFAGLCALMFLKIPSRPIRRALLALALAYAYLGVANLMTLSLPADLQSLPLNLLGPELGALLALWYAYETSARLQTSSI